MGTFPDNILSKIVDQWTIVPRNIEKHYILLLPEGQMGRVWEHSTENVLSKIVDLWTTVPRNTVWETLHIVFTRRTNGQSLGTFHRKCSFENRGSLDNSSAEHSLRKHDILLLPEGQMGRVWKHSTDNALSNIWDQSIQNNFYTSYSYVLQTYFSVP